MSKKIRKSRIFEITLAATSLTTKLSLDDRLVFSSQDDYIRLRSKDMEVCRLQKEDNYLWELIEFCIFTPKILYIPPKLRPGSELFLTVEIEIMQPIQVSSRTLSMFLTRTSALEHSIEPSSIPVPNVGVDLKPHQIEALEFMFRIENSSSWKRLPQEMWYSIPQGRISFSNDYEREERGGILADQMGLGKTRSMVALIKTGGSTLVVCPLTVVGQWIQEAEDASLTTCLYYGQDRKVGDLTITTFGTLGSEYKKDSPLFRRWDRVILDEAHLIKSSQTVNFNACCLLVAWNRWCVTGTPIVNSTDDVINMLKFLRIDHEASNADNVIKEFMLRRTKDERDSEGKLILQLPKKVVKIEYLDFTTYEQTIYDEWFTKSKKLVKGKSITHVFAQLLRMRQLCCHPELVKELENNPDPLAEECPVCLDSKVDRILPCSHEICSSCLDDIVNANMDKGQSHLECVICRTIYNEKDVKTVSLRNIPFKTPTSLSTKISALLSHIDRLNTLWITQTPSEREHVVIFSQFTTFLDIISINLSKRGFEHTKLLGNMNRDQRQKSINDFQKHGCRIILASLRCAGLGVTLTRGSKLFLMDPWWNAAVEEQAIDRVHRMGQIRPVEVIRFVMKGSVEEHLLDIQNRKLEAVERLDIGKELLDVFK